VDTDAIKPNSTAATTIWRTADGTIDRLGTRRIQ
jgi:hypothetical protein